MKLTLFFLCFTCRLLSQSWVQLPDFPGTERDDGSTFVINNNAYCLTGLDVGFQCTANGFVFDGGSETWSPMASLPAGNERQYATAFSYGAYGYLFGGINSSNVCLNDFWKYDPVADSWTALSDFPGAGRQGMCSFVIHNKVYIVGGKLTDGTVLKDVWAYDPALGTWTQKTDIPVNGLWRGSGFSINNVGYMGYGMSDSQSYNHFFYTYNDLADTWTKVNGITLPARKYIGTAVCYQGAGLYGGQDSTGNIINELIMFDPSNNSITWKAGIPTFGRKGSMAFSLNNVFYLTTGVTNTTRVKETWKALGAVGMKEVNETNPVRVYPNPATTELTVSIAGSTQKDAVIEIYNAIGKCVLLEPFSERLDISKLSSGVYVLFVKDKAQVFQSRFIKE